MVTYYFAFKKILPNTKEAKCEKCGLEASSNESVRNSFGLFLDNNKPAISKICKDCERTADQHDKQMRDAFG